MSSIRSVCVYCGSSPGRNGLYLEAGTTLGRAIADAGLRLVYGGGTKGIMGAVAAGATERGGRITGIIPRFLIRKEAGEHAPQALDEFVVVENMHERKHRMFEESDAFVARPGGVGTLEEIMFGPSRTADGTMNLVGALRRAMATTGYTEVKEFQRIEVVVQH